MTPPTTPPEIHTCTLHYTKNTHQDLDKPGISSVWIIYLQTHTTWHVINFHEQAILESRLSSANLSRASRRAIYDFQLRELDAAPRILERCVDSDNGEARITKRVKEFGRVEESIGMRRLLREFGEMMRMQEIPVDELYIPPLFLLWLESLNLKPPKTKKTNPKTKPHNPPETPLSSDHNKPVPQTPPHHPNFKIAIQVQKFDTGNVQETWIWNETRALLKQTNHSGPNKSGLYIIPNPYPSPPPPPSSPSPSTLVLFAWTHGSLTTENNKLYAQGRCFTFSPPAPHSNIPPPVHLHPVSNKSSTPSPHFAATINLSHFSNQWEDYKVDVNQPAIPCMWWKDNITILDDGVLLREYEELYESSKRKGGPHFTLSTFLAQIFHTINTTIPPSKKRANKNKSPNDDIDIPELYERGRQDLARSKRSMYCLRELALTTSHSFSHSSSQPPRSQSLPARTETPRNRSRKADRSPDKSPAIHRVSSSSQKRTDHQDIPTRSRSRLQSCNPSQSRCTSKPTHELKRTFSHSPSPSPSPFPSQPPNPNNRSHKLHSTRTRTHSLPPSRSTGSNASSNSNSTSKQRQSSLERSEPKSTPQSKHPRNPSVALSKTRKLFAALPAPYSD